MPASWHYWLPASWPKSFSAMPEKAAFALAALLLAALGLLDFVTGYFFRLSMLYLAPIVFASWRCGSRAGLMLCVPAAIFAALTEYHGAGGAAHPAISFWNVIVSLGVYVFSVYAVQLLKTRIDVERRHAAQLMELKNSLEESRLSFKQAQSLARIGSWEYTPALDRMRWSMEFFNLLGLDPAKTHPGLAPMLNRMKGPDKADFVGMLAEARQKTTTERDIPIRTPAGEEKILHWQVTRMPTAMEETFLGTAQDLTRRRRLEQLREDVERMVQHDLRTPLGNIIHIPGLMLEEGGLTPEQEDQLKAVAESGETILRMINLSLDIHHMERGRFVLRPNRMDLCALIRRVTADLASLSKSKKLCVELTMDGRPLTPQDALEARGDKTLCYAMLANLEKNAMEAAPEGSAVRVALDRRGDDAFVAVRNEGSIPPAFKDRIFDKYATQGKPGGTGLGTYSARLIARAHKGDLTLDCAPGRGVTFTVRLPLAPAA